MSSPYLPHTVTFDCWQTLMYEADSAPSRGASARRAELFAALLGVAPDRVRAALADAWSEHQRAWHKQVAFGGPEMTAHALAALGVNLDPTQRKSLIETLEDDLLNRNVCAVEGSRELLTRLREAGIRTALICDTGFSPGRVVRQMLARVGLLDLLEVQVFSDEVRVPKPHARAFTSALDALRAPARGAIHVGDIRRTDVAGALAAGMGAVRFRGRHDDADVPEQSRTGRAAGVSDCDLAGCNPVCPRPEADAVVDTYVELEHHLTKKG